MDRRDSIKALGTLLAGAGVTASPVTTHEADQVQLVILRTPIKLSQAQIESLHTQWKRVVEGTALDGVRVAVFEFGLDVEFVRK